MPPKAKKPALAPRPKRTARATKTTPKTAVQNPPEDVPVEKMKAPEVKAEKAPVLVKEAFSAKVDVAETKPTTILKDPSVDQKDNVKAEATGPVTAEKDDDKETVDEYERGEQLDLEDNDPEYEPEGYVDEDYDEKEVEEEYIEEEEDEVLEELEEGDEGEDEEGDEGEDEEGDVAGEDTEDDPDELEIEEEDDHASEEHEELVDAVEEEEHHDVVKERRKRKEYEVFVGGLDKNATEKDLRKVFSRVGEILEVRLMMNQRTKKNKGFAFLRFATIEQAKRAVTELKNPVVNGKQCCVTPSQDSDTLFLGNICKTWTKEALDKKLKLYGIANIEDFTLVEDSSNPGTNKGFAFLEFSSRSDAMNAFKRLQKRDVVFGVHRPAKVSFAGSFVDPGDEIMSQVKTVFVDGLPASWDEGRVRDALKKYGQVENIELARNMTSARRKDFGFVTFDTHDTAVTCVAQINNEELGEGDAKVKVRARLSRPLQRGKGRRVPRGDYRGGRAAVRSVRVPWNRSLPRTSSGTRAVGSHAHLAADRRLKRPIGLRSRRPAMPGRARALPPPPRLHDRRSPVPAYHKSSLKRDYLIKEITPRSRVAGDYGSKGTVERHPVYRDDYSARAPGYSELHISNASRLPSRRPYADDGYGPRYERPTPMYHEGRARDYDLLSGSKRPYSAVGDPPPRYADSSARHSRAHMDYEIGGQASQHGDAYGDRLVRSNIGYSSRSSMSSHDAHGIYSSRQEMAYTGGSYGGSNGSTYSSNYGGNYSSRGSDVGGSSYSSLHSSRGYVGGGGSGAYY
ncbi:hypothetical protein Dimus_024412 [Dionaea muscipula]